MSRSEVVVIGGGFYGCCIALFLRSVADRVTVLESRDDLLTRASYVNQARVHTGFHYPRSFVTAARSLKLYPRFMRDFAPAIVSDFQMIYAIARQGSKVSANRFETMFQELGAPIRRAGAARAALFDPRRVEQAFACDEFAFDAIRLRELLRDRLARARVDVRLATRAESVQVLPERSGLRTTLVGGEEIESDVVFNATYGCLNELRLPEGAAPLPVKNEWTEVALVEPLDELRGLGVTVMDGPFFSVMPFPARAAYSLTHVRYTPQEAWTAGDSRSLPGAGGSRSRWLHMKRDASRYMPCLEALKWRESLFEIKTVLLRNEVDDGRPIFFYAHPEAPGLYSVLGGKLDKIYDLFEVLTNLGHRWSRATPEWLVPAAEARGLSGRGGRGN